MAFNTFWGDIGIDADKIEKVEETPTENSKEELKVEVEEPAKELTVDKAEAEEAGEDEYEYTDDDISKAYTLLEEQGVLDLAEDDEFESTPKGLGDAIHTTVEKKVHEKINSLPEEVKALYYHMQGGKDVSEFSFQGSTDWSTLDLKSEANQEKAAREHLKTQGLEPDEIDSEIEDYKELNKLDRKADLAIRVLSKADANRTTQAKDKKDKDHKSAEKARTAEIDTIKSSIDAMDDYAGFKLDEEKKTGFKEYLFKLDKRTGKSKMQENMSDEDRRLRIAFLDYMDYTKQDLEKEVASKLTKDRKKKLTRFSNKNVKNSNSSASVKQNTENKGSVVIPSIFGGQSIELED